VLPEETRALYEHAKSLRAPWESEIRDAFRYTFPSRDFDRVTGQPIDRSFVYDTTAPYSIRNLVTQAMRLLIPQNQKWATIEFRSKATKRQWHDLFKEWIVRSDDIMSRTFLTSGFYTAFLESMTDCAVAGTGCYMIVDNGVDPITYRSVPLREIYFTENGATGKVDTVFRCSSITARQLEQRFPNAQPQTLSQHHNLIEAVIPSFKGVKYCVYLESNWQLLQEEYGDFNPFFIWRWDKPNGDVWGVGPVRGALPAIRTVNRMKKDLLIAGAFIARGLWQSQGEPPTQQGENYLEPGSILYLDDPLQAVPFPTNFPITLEMIKNEQGDIRQMLYNNFLSNDPARPTYMNDAELFARRDQFISQVGGEPTQRMLYEAVEQTAIQQFARLQKRGEIQQITPQQLEGIGMSPGTKASQVFRIRIDAAINRSIRQQEVQRDLETLVSLTQAIGDPSLVTKHIDMDELVRNSLEGLGFNLSALRSEAQVKAINQQLEEQNQQLQALSVVSQAGQAMNSVSNAASQFAAAERVATQPQR
jgi:hypothetical protein